MLQLSQVETELLAFLLEHRESEAPVHSATDLLGSGLLDSLLLVDLVLHIQNVYGVIVTAGDVTTANFRDVGALARMIVGKSRGAGEKAA